MAMVIDSAARICYGQAVQLSPLVQRITAPNPGLMTGQGTNTYIVGRSEVVVIDPGPSDPSHLVAIADACQGRLRAILLTHTHRDHAPAAIELAARTGVPIIGRLLTEDDGKQTPNLRIDVSPAADELLRFNGFALKAIDTPGHVDNHLCYWLAEEQWLFAGDHIMQGSTVVIIPPYGNMQAYIRSLQRLQQESLVAIAPGHGCLIYHPQQEVERLVAHRLGRERRVLAALQSAQWVDLECLLQRVYSDVPEILHGMAKYSLLAHLIKLQNEGLVMERAGAWSLLKAV